MILPQKRSWSQHSASSRKEKAGGKTGIPPELVAYEGSELCDRLLELLKVVWEEKKVVKDWKDAEIVPVPEREIINRVTIGVESVFAAAGKMFARIIQERLQIIAEPILPE